MSYFTRAGRRLSWETGSRPGSSASTFTQAFPTFGETAPNIGIFFNAPSAKQCAFRKAGEDAGQTLVGLAREKPEKAGLEFALARADLHARTVGTRAHREPAYSVVKKSIAAEFVHQLLCGGTPLLRRLARFQFGGVKEDALPHTSLGRLRDFLEHDLRPRALHFKRGVGSWPAQEGVNAGVKIARFCTTQKLGNARAQASEGMGKVVASSARIARL